MPNHIHGIIRITHSGFNRAGFKHRAGFEPAPTRVALPEIVRQFKTFSAKQINALRGTTGKPIWQGNYYDHIIRDEKSLFVIRKYIRENPIRWKIDSENHIDREIKDFFPTPELLAK